MTDEGPKAPPVVDQNSGAGIGVDDVDVPTTKQALAGLTQVLASNKSGVQRYALSMVEADLAESKAEIATLRAQAVSAANQISSLKETNARITEKNRAFAKALYVTEFMAIIGGLLVGVGSEFVQGDPWHAGPVIVLGVVLVLISYLTKRRDIQKDIEA